MALVLTTPPDTEPVSTAEMKLHSRVDIDTDDAKIAMLITAARELVESITGQQCITATYTLTLDRFPFDDFIELPKSPLQSVTSVSYVDTAGVTQTFSASNYDSESSIDGYGRIYVDRSVGWPSVKDQRNAVTIVYKAGYGDAATTVPERLVQAIMLVAADWYENREASVMGSLTALPTGIKMLLNNLKIRGGLNAHELAET